MGDMYSNTLAGIFSVATNPIRYCSIRYNYLCSSCNGSPGLPGKERVKFKKFKSYRIIYFIILQTAVSKLKYCKIHFFCFRLYISTAVQTQQI